MMMCDVHAASCSTTSANNYSVSAGNRAIPRDQPVGSLIGGKAGQPAGTQGYNFSCAGDTNVDRDAYLKFTVLSPPVSGYTDVYPTNLGGVGVRYNLATNSGNTSLCNIPFDQHIINSTYTVTCHIPAATNIAWSWGTSVEFVKTGPISPGMLTSVPRVSMSYSLNNQAGNWPLSDMYTGTASGNFNFQSCLVTTTNVLIPLTSAAGISTRTFTGMGSASNWTNDVPILLDCTGVLANVYMTVTDATDRTNTSSFLSLTPASSATGVGIELSVSGTPKMSFGPDSSTVGNLNQFRIANATGPSVRINLSARYVQRAVRVTSGTANGAATFTMAYQ